MSAERLTALSPRNIGCCVIYTRKTPSPYEELYDEVVRLRAELAATQESAQTRSHDARTRRKDKVTLVENPTPFTISTAIYPDAAGIMRRHNLASEYGMTEAGMLEAIHEAIEEAQATVTERFGEFAADANGICPHYITNTSALGESAKANRFVFTAVLSVHSAAQLDNFEKMLKAAANILMDPAWYEPVILEALPAIVSRMREEEQAHGEKFQGV